MVKTDVDSNKTLVTDQALKQRMSQVNALGQMTDVFEIKASDGNTVPVTFAGVSATGYQTSYAYDPLNNLTTVTQGSQTRSFAYSSLSRLTSAANPESGTTSYIYDANGNLSSKTDARSITTSYVYDQLNRVTQRSYTNDPQSTPTVTYTYDNLTYAKGKLTKVSNANSTTEYTGFDILGRVTGHKQTTDGTAYTTGYTYYLDGSLKDETYPSGRVVHNDLKLDGQLAAVTSKKTPGAQFFNYAGGISYSAAGAVTGLQLGNGLWESTVFNSRLQPTNINLGTTAGATDKLNLVYGYGSTQNNGNVMSQTITVPGMTYPLMQNYTYDELNRITSVLETSNGVKTWNQTYKFDRYGNRTFDTNTANTSQPTSFDAKTNPSISPSTNRITSAGYVYDSAGNITTDGSGNHFTFDGEDKQTEVRNSSNAVISDYYFDGDGNRVKKSLTSGETTAFVYDAGNKLVAEYSTNVLPTGTAQVNYLTTDNLGTPRINTDKSGGVTSRHDYMPYGEEIGSEGGRTTSLKYNPDFVRQGFTGYQDDRGEAGLDFAEARNYNSQNGRFTTVDPLSASAAPTDPQTFNRYAYTSNHPLMLSDPHGTIPGDYYDHEGNYLGRDKNPTDGKVYFATPVRRGETWTTVDGNSVRETSYTAVRQARIDAVPLSPGTEGDILNPLAESVVATARAGYTGIAKGIANTVIDTLNFGINPTGPGLDGLGIGNPVAIPNLQYDGEAEASYAHATQFGIAAGTVAAGAVLLPAASISVVP